jgi:hypothetical protein
VLVLGLVLLVAIAGVAAFPCWRHSRHFGYAPSASAGILLLVVALMAVGHKSDAPTTHGPTMARSSNLQAPD